MAYAAVSVTTSAKLIVAANAQRHSLVLHNASGGARVYLGPDSSITASNAIPFDMGSNWDADSGGVKMYTGPIYGITSSGTADVRYWERTDFR